MNSFLTGFLYPQVKLGELSRYRRDERREGFIGAALLDYTQNVIQAHGEHILLLREMPADIYICTRIRGVAFS